MINALPAVCLPSLRVLQWHELKHQVYLKKYLEFQLYFTNLLLLGTPNKSDKSDSVILLDSSDEDEKKSDKKTASFEPDITKVESNDLISKHLDKIKGMYFYLYKCL